MTAVLPPLLVSLANRELGAPAGTAAWGWTAVAGLLLGVAAGPPLGALADARGWRVRLLGIFAFLGAGATIALALALPVSWRWGAVLYVVAATGFASANIFYDALLPALGPREQWDELSARGYSYGYLGGGVALAIAGGLVVRMGERGLPWAFVVAGAWWAVFTVPVVTAVREPAPEHRGRVWAQLAATFRAARRRPVLWRFLLAYWLYNDGIGTIIKMAAAYGAELGIPMSHMLGALLATQLVGVPATLAFGAIGRRWGPRRGIAIALGGYIAITFLGFAMREAWHFWVLAGLVGVVQGGAQALSRSLFARLVPRGREAELFSFYDLSGRFAGVIGPALFALATMLTGSARSGVLVVLVTFVGGLWLLRTVPDDPGSQPGI
ncbi:MAG: MFS transporter [Thermoanaerobaculaceae bacterium]|nr:MFS transporter [Thermoanaerobaculaceae bacterium]NLH12809.1 MFS transporter [Holophagae bacterium]